MKEVVRQAILLLVLVLVQVVLFDHIALFGVATPIVFIYFIVQLGLSVGPNLLMVLGFLTGFAVDVCADTPGLNALACTVMAALKRPMLSAYCAKAELEVVTVPTATTLGLWTYTKFAASLVLVYCLVLYGVEYLSFANVGFIALRVCCSAVLSTVLLLGIDSLVVNPREKRL